MADTILPFWAIKTERGWVGSDEWTSVPCESTRHYRSLVAADGAIQPVKHSYEFVQVWRNDSDGWTLVSTYTGGTSRYARAEHHNKPVGVADHLERVEAQPIEATAPTVEEFFQRRKVDFAD